MNLLEKLKMGIAGGLVAVAAIYSSGCAVSKPLAEYRLGEDSSIQFNLRGGARFGLSNIPLSEEARLVPVHEADRQNALAPGVIHKSENMLIIEPYFGGEAEFNYGILEIKAGADISYCINPTVSRIREPLPAGQGYESYSEFNISPTYSASPFVGVAFNFDRVYIGAEAGLFYSEICAEGKRERYGGKETVKKDSDSGMGEMLRAKVGFEREDGGVELIYEYKTQNVELFNERTKSETHSVTLNFIWDF